MILRKRTFQLVAMLGAIGLLGPALAPATAKAQTIVVTAKSLKDLAGDLEYLIKTVVPDEDPNAGAMLGALKQFQEGELVKGLDQSRGFGVAVTLPADFPQGGPPSVVAAVPVTNLGEFLDSIRGFGLPVDDKPGVEGFSHKVTAPDGNTTLFLLESKGYALFSLVPEAGKLKGLDPASWSPKDRPAADLSWRVRLAEIPQALKDQFLEQLKAQVGQQEDRRPNESDVEYQSRLAGQKAGIETFTALVRDGDAIALALEVDRKTSEMALELSISAKPGTEMARSLRAFRGRRSRFENLGGRGPLATWMCFPMSQELREGISRGLESAAKSAPPNVTTPEQRKVFDRFLELVKSNLGESEFDAGMAMSLPAPEGGRESHYTMLMGLKVRDGRAFERLARDAAAQFAPEKSVTFTFDAARATDGTPIHQVTGPLDKNKTDEKVVRTFGKASLCFAFREDVILGAFGEDSMAAIRRALEGLSAPPPPASGPVEPVALVARLAGSDIFADEKARDDYRHAAAETFRGEAAQKDRFSLVLQGEGDAIRLRLAIDVPALKFLAMIGKASKK